MERDRVDASMSKRARRRMINEVGKHQSCMVSLFAGGLAEERERIKARLHALEKQKAFLDKGGTPPSAASSSTTSRGSAGACGYNRTCAHQICM